MAKRLILLILVLIGFTSCTIRIMGITNDYKYLNESQENKISELQSFDKVENGLIYEINGSQLRKELKNHPKSLIYFFSNGCKSEQCYPLMVYENFARANDYKLFLVMGGYNNLDETLDQPISSPLFAINSEFYGTKSRRRYSRFFTNEISGKSMNDKESKFEGVLYFFKEDKLQKVLMDLPSEIP